MNLCFMYFMEYEIPSFRPFEYFINKVDVDSVEDIFNDINKKIFEKGQVDLQHFYIYSSEFPHKKGRMKKNSLFSYVQSLTKNILEKSRYQKN